MDSAVLEDERRSCDNRIWSMFCENYSPILEEKEDQQAEIVTERECQHNGSFRSFHKYYDMLVRCKFYRLYLCSHICQHIGDWFVRIATLLAVQRLAPTGNSGRSLAILVITNMLPRAFLSQVGGSLADCMDRRKLMIVLDISAGIATLGYMVAIMQESLALLYIVSTVRATLSAMYYSPTTGLVPLIVPDVDDLKLAVTMNNWAWSIMAIIGGVLAGSAAELIGLEACFVVDTVTYFISACFIVRIKGNFNVCKVHNDSEPHNVSGCLQSAKNFISYLKNCNFAALVLMKATAAFVWGPEDILGVAFSTVDGDEDETSFHMGCLFSMIGLGCLFGPSIISTYADPKKPKTLQVASIVGVAILMLGWLAISTLHNFWLFILWSAFRASGSAVVWVYSTITLQTLSDKEMLGRVLAVEYASFTICEAISATISGKMLDAGYTKNEIAFLASVSALVLLCFWNTYHWLGCGAARHEFNGLVEVPRTESPVTVPVDVVDQFDDDFEGIELGTRSSERRRSKTRRRSSTSETRKLPV